MRSKKLLASSAIILASAATLAACGSNSSQSSAKKQTLTWMNTAEMTTLDASKATDQASYEQINNVEEGLYLLGKNAKVQNALATSTKNSADGKTWTFTIRKDAKWSNGDPVTAKDFVYSWRRTIDPKTASEYAYLFSGIKNADAIVSGKKKPAALGIKADGKYKLTVTLEKRIPYFKLLMAFPLFFPQNQKFIEKMGSKYATSSKYMVYNGPFKQVGWTGSNLSWKLVKNPTYWDKKSVKLDTVKFSVQKTPSTDYNLYQSGKLDAAFLDAQATKSLKGKTGYTQRKMSTTQYLSYNLKKHPEFKNKNLRLAISMAINRKELASTLGGAATPATTFDPEGMTTVNGQDYADTVKNAATEKAATYNVKEAKKLYKQALKETGKKKISFTLLGDDDDTAKKAAEFVQSQLENNLGIDVQVQSIPKKTRLTRMMNGNFDVVSTGWNADFSDPISFLDLQTTGASYNYGKWSNKTYDKYVAASKTTSSTSDRFKDLAKAEQVLLAEQGVTPLYHPIEAWMVKPSVKGVIYNGAGANYSFKYAYLK
ncbi:peptide ABC transporter substrate-binding protein [Lactobacillus delbrueckii subsp. allosunkii]|uniref:Peptide ABC transporter substrate-binding protein n=1 Tax=Lactobacillus delbrueckii subsp. allosunkii TaxID=1050107 RepID=A0ABD4SEE1_9LACO|nr:peptide ABC transporter substrate-binding protein [Lactobacillus delbrueckii]MCD5518015.1 peptide ABC transporter substrate-binding protein [Lactobacillus delbrueckii subsp. sunkii]MCT3475774.1 peptide ABC transporter substrate-binding protein [Lactobacillus delbrueckii subsp. lactis]MCZ0776568.1 peptide ABC transporter substrate-binding protein [Lactobacillus delbrueckii subsp. sunkii]MCZ0788376.1 peptide ABC transporter substrate-binding protein [Lactobacillus delbrueckii subsp. sunkii]MC